MSTASKALSLYRQSLRLARDWKGTPEERSYILREASHLFRRNRDISDPETIKAKLFEAESRIALAAHYRIHYPRPYHFDRSSKSEGFAYVESAYMHTQDEFFIE